VGAGAVNSDYLLHLITRHEPQLPKKALPLMRGRPPILSRFLRMKLQFFGMGGDVVIVATGARITRSSYSKQLE
jgi:hypothetical protein